jgi:hypothetical protein
MLPKQGDEPVSRTAVIVDEIVASLGSLATKQRGLAERLLLFRFFRRFWRVLDSLSFLN